MQPLRLIPCLLLALTALTAFSGAPAGAPGGPDTARAAGATQRMVALARAELRRGVREIPDGSNRSTRIRMYGMSTRPRFYPAPWCAYFVSWIARRAGRPLGPSGQGFGYVPYIRAWAVRTKRWRRTPRSGDLVMFPQHVGMVESVSANGTLTTIEGNSSNRVARRWRRWRDASGYVRFATGGTVLRPGRRPSTTKAPKAPTAVALRARISAYPGTTVAVGQLVGLSANDSSGDIVRYRWDLDGDGSYDDARTDNAQWKAAVAGEHSLKLRLTDRRGRTAYSSVTVRVGDNVAPVARLELPETARVNSRVVLDAGGSTDEDGEIARFEWDTDGDGQWQAGAERQEVSFDTPGVHTIGLRVVDERGAVTELVRTILVTHRAPVARLSAPRRAALGDTVTFDGQGSYSSDTRIAAHRWDFDGDGTADAEGARPSWRFTTPGTRRVRLVVVDAWGTEAATDVAVEVTNAAPVAKLTLPGRALPGTGLVFEAGASSDADSAIAHYDWDFDDDWHWDAAGASVVRQLPSGDHRIRLRVTDEWGATSVVSSWLHVLAPPVPRVTVTTSAPRVGSSTSMNASGSSDPDGRIVKLEWDLTGDGRADRTTTSTTSSVSWVFPTLGEHTVTMTATDDSGLSATAQARVTVR